MNLVVLLVAAEERDPPPSALEQVVRCQAATREVVADHGAVAVAGGRPPDDERRPRLDERVELVRRARGTEEDEAVRPPTLEVLRGPVRVVLADVDDEQVIAERMQRARHAALELEHERVRHGQVGLVRVRDERDRLTTSHAQTLGRHVHLEPVLPRDRANAFLRRGGNERAVVQRP